MAIANKEMTLGSLLWTDVATRYAPMSLLGALRRCFAAGYRRARTTHAVTTSASAPGYVARFRLREWATCRRCSEVWSRSVIRFSGGDCPITGVLRETPCRVAVTARVTHFHVTLFSYMFGCRELT